MENEAHLSLNNKLAGEGRKDDIVKYCLWERCLDFYVFNREYVGQVDWNIVCPPA